MKTVDADGHGGWTFEGFDQYGHCFISSRSYSKRETCEKAARAEIERMSGGVYGECAAVVWPPTAKVTGTLIGRGKRRNHG